MYQANNNIQFLMLMKTSYKLKEATPFESAHTSTHFALFWASRIFRLFRMEWVDHLDRVGQVGAQTAKPFVLIFCLNLKSIQFHLRTVRMQEEEDSSSSPKQPDRAARARNLSNPGCDARNPGGGTKLAQARFQSSSGKHFQGIFQSWVNDNLYGHEFGNLLGSL